MVTYHIPADVLRGALKLPAGDVLACEPDGAGGLRLTVGASEEGDRTPRFRTPHCRRLAGWEVTPTTNHQPPTTASGASDEHTGDAPEHGGDQDPDPGPGV